MAAAGIHLVCLSTMNTANSCGEPYTTYPPLWRWFGAYCWDGLDQQINDTLAIDPQARFFCVLDLNSPQWLARQLRIDSFCSLSSCALNEKWKAHTLDYLHAFLGYCEETWGGRVEGYIVACGATLEWLEPDCADITSPKISAYPGWCAASNLPLRALPSREEIRNCRHDFYRDPQSEAHVIQWLRFVNDITADLAIEWITAARQSIRQEAKIGMFFGPVFHMMPEGHHACERVFDTAKPDFIIGAACNSAGDMGLASGYIGTLKMLERRGIGYLHECDRLTSQSNTRLSDHINLTSGIWRPYCHTVADDIACLQREMAMCMINRFHLWWFNIWGKAYCRPEIKALMGQMRELWKKYAPLSTGSSAEVLLVHDPESNFYVSYHHHPHQHYLAHRLRDEFSRSGVAFDTAAWNDLEFIDLTQYRMVVFQNFAVQTQHRRDILERRIARNGRVLVWIDGAGIITDGHYFPPAVKELTGAEFRCPDQEMLDHEQWRSVYLAEPSLLDAAAIRKFAATAGVHFYCPPGNAVWHSKEFVMIHRAGAGEVEITLPETGGEVTDLFSGNEYDVVAHRFHTNFHHTGTRLFCIQHSLTSSK